MAVTYIHTSQGMVKVLIQYENVEKCSYYLSFDHVNDACGQLRKLFPCDDHVFLPVSFGQTLQSGSNSSYYRDDYLKKIVIRKDLLWDAREFG